jgi:hypothetical protein
MKTSALGIWIIFFSLNSFAVEPSDSWIESKEGKYLCTKVSIHARNARIVLPNGKKMSIPVDKINSYKSNDCEFVKLPLYKNGKITDMVFMQLICRYKECALYRYGHCKVKYIQSREGVSNYYIYKGEDLHMASNCIGLPEACLNYSIKKRYK